jgi:5-oxoprolinase (ATP-hydrolysing)
LPKKTTTVVEPGWEAQLTALDHLVLLERRVARVVTFAAGTRSSGAAGSVQQPVRANIAEQMGLQPQNTAYSVNIMLAGLQLRVVRYRWQPDQRATHASAPAHGREYHIVIRENTGRMQPGDVCTNDPYHAASHPPDVTVIMPFTWNPAEATPMFYGFARSPRRLCGTTLVPHMLAVPGPASRKRACRSTTSSLRTCGVARGGERWLLQSGEFSAQPRSAKPGT